MSKAKVRAADSFGRTFDRPRLLVNDINVLDPGHHVACGRFPNTVYEYHGIVESVDYCNDKVNIIGTVKRPRFGKIGNRRVEKYTLIFSQTVFYIVIYQPDEELSEEDTLSRAKSQVGIEFNFRSSNSFATACKLVPHATIISACADSDREKKLTYGGGAGSIAAGSVGTVGLTIAETVAEGGMTAGSAALSSVKVIAPLAVVGGAVEVASAGYHTHKAARLKKEGRITQRQYDDAVATRWINAVTNTAGPVGGAVGGAAIGAVITGPAAPIGAVVGGIVGGIVGLVGGFSAGVGLSAAGRSIRDALESRDEDQRILEEIQARPIVDEETDNEFHKVRLGFALASDEESSVFSLNDSEEDSTMDEVDLQMRPTLY